MDCQKKMPAARQQRSDITDKELGFIPILAQILPMGAVNDS
jgi:hypothetical protein